MRLPGDLYTDCKYKFDYEYDLETSNLTTSTILTANIEIVLKIVLVSIMSIIVILLELCGTVLIFFSAHSVFITAERSAMKHHI